MMKQNKQNHLSSAATVNLGAYYTNTKHIQIVQNIISTVVEPNSIILDNACGYGGFLTNNKNEIGCDIDPIAVKQAIASNPNCNILQVNALYQTSRKQFNISEQSHLIVIGNPPYNDRTSQIRKTIKNEKPIIDDDLKTRDLGISFLRSYDKLKADWVCVLHPLSYLLKRTNFNQLGSFSKNYSLKIAKVFSSAEFPDNSKISPFPIVIALYKREKGMSYDQVCKFRFEESKIDFAVNDFLYLENFVNKYPRKIEKEDFDGISFYTMRDINALKRNQTFLFKSVKNSVPISKNQIYHYVYADVFKRFASHVPYYFSNSNIMIDDKLYQKYHKYFLQNSLSYHPQLINYLPQSNVIDNADDKILEYFKKLLGKHFV